MGFKEQSMGSSQPPNLWTGATRLGAYVHQCFSSTTFFLFPMSGTILLRGAKYSAFCDLLPAIATYYTVHCGITWPLTFVRYES